MTQVTPRPASFRRVSDSLVGMEANPNHEVPLRVTAAQVAQVLDLLPDAVTVEGDRIQLTNAQARRLLVLACRPRVGVL